MLDKGPSAYFASIELNLPMTSAQSIQVGLLADLKTSGHQQRLSSQATSLSWSSSDSATNR
jgi:hypothetical protein